MCQISHHHPHPYWRRFNFADEICLLYKVEIFEHVRTNKISNWYWYCNQWLHILITIFSQIFSKNIIYIAKMLTKNQLNYPYFLYLAIKWKKNTWRAFIKGQILAGIYYPILTLAFVVYSFKKRLQINLCHQISV